MRRLPARSRSRLVAVSVAGLTAVVGTAASDHVRAAPVVMAAPGGATLEPVAELPGVVDLAWRADDPAMYAVTQPGEIVRIDDTGPTVVFDGSDLITNQGEQGLLGLAFSPDGTLAFVNFTDTDGNTVIAELPVAADHSLSRDQLRVVLTIEQPYPNHNGGDLAFGPDGLLYIGMGDGGSADDPDRRALDLSDPLGKLLRIDPAPSGDLGYTIPSDNPYVGVDGARGEIWSIGLRNPWRFSFDDTTGDLWIADVGQGEFEEIDVAPATDGVDAGRGVNFGWSAYEGFEEFNADVLADAADHHPPIHVYDHSSGDCSVSGGAVAHGQAAGGLDGRYVFADYCSGKVWALAPAADLTTGEVTEVANAGTGTTAVVAGPDGTVYVLNATGIHRLVA